MLQSILNSIFGCSHQRTTFPMTPARKSASHNHKGTYVVYLDCGKEFAYNWDEMRMEAPVVVAAVTAPASRLSQPGQGLSRLLRLGG